MQQKKKGALFYMVPYGVMENNALKIILYFSWKIADRMKMGMKNMQERFISGKRIWPLSMDCKNNLCFL